MNKEVLSIMFSKQLTHQKPSSEIWFKEPLKIQLPYEIRPFMIFEPTIIDPLPFQDLSQEPESIPIPKWITLDSVSHMKQLQRKLTIILPDGNMRNIKDCRILSRSTVIFPNSNWRIDEHGWLNVSFTHLSPRSSGENMILYPHTYYADNEKDWYGRDKKLWWRLYRSIYCKNDYYPLQSEYHRISPAPGLEPPKSFPCVLYVSEFPDEKNVISINKDVKLSEKKWLNRNRGCRGGRGEKKFSS